MMTFDEWWNDPKGVGLPFPDTGADLKEWCRLAVESCTPDISAQYLQLEDGSGMAMTLDDVFALVRVENEASNQKYPDWRELSDDVQGAAVRDEYFEWRRAFMRGDTHGEHGEIAELIDLQNVAAKRIIYLSQLAERVANNDTCKCGDWERDQGHNPACHLCTDSGDVPIPPPSMLSKEAIEVLIAYAERRDEFVHANDGMCPDVFEGHDVRDPDCIICRALLAVNP